MFIPTPFGLQICAAWIKEISVLLVRARVGAQAELKQMDASQCCQGLWLLFDSWRDCRSLNSGWNLTYSEATLISYLWIGAPGPKGEKGMSGASEEGSQGPRGRTGRVTPASVYWCSKAKWGPPALRFKASSSWRTSVVGLDSPSHHSPVGSILNGSSLLKYKRLLQAASSLWYPFPGGDVFWGHETHPGSFSFAAFLHARPDARGIEALKIQLVEHKGLWVICEDLVYSSTLIPALGTCGKFATGITKQALSKECGQTHSFHLIVHIWDVKTQTPITLGWILGLRWFSALIFRWVWGSHNQALILAKLCTLKVKNIGIQILGSRIGFPTGRSCLSTKMRKLCSESYLPCRMEESTAEVLHC